MAILGMLARGLAGGVKAAATGGFASRAAIGAGIGGVSGFATSDYENANLTIGDTLRGAAVGGLIGGALGLNKNIGRMIAPAGKAAWKSTPTSLLAKGLTKSVFSSAKKGSTEGFFARQARMGEERLGKMARAAVPIGPLQKASRTKVMGASPLGRQVSGAMNMATMPFKYPLAAAGVAGAGYLGYSQLTRSDSPTLSGDLESAQRGMGVTTKVDYNSQALAAETLRESGLAPMGSMGSVPQMMGPGQRAFQNSTQGLVQGLHQSRH